MFVIVKVVGCHWIHIGRASITLFGKRAGSHGVWLMRLRNANLGSLGPLKVGVEVCGSLLFLLDWLSHTSWGRIA